MQSETKSPDTLLRLKVITGTVISDKMDKTIVVRITDRTKHPKYKKIMKTHSKFKAHDAKNEAKVGDTVKIVETRPISKDKRWRLIGVSK
ncbi:30S ribosomal protein S17 [Candidatus Omnitrophota bacterium]